jgi:hypothetical protein
VPCVTEIVPPAWTGTLIVADAAPEDPLNAIVPAESSTTDGAAPPPVTVELPFAIVSVPAFSSTPPSLITTASGQPELATVRLPSLISRAPSIPEQFDNDPLALAPTVNDPGPNNVTPMVENPASPDKVAEPGSDTEPSSSKLGDPLNVGEELTDPLVTASVPGPVTVDALESETFCTNRVPCVTEIVPPAWTGT